MLKILKLTRGFSIINMYSSESDAFVSITTSDVFLYGSHMVNPSEVLPASAGVSGPRPVASVLGTGSSVLVFGATTSFRDLGLDGQDVARDVGDTLTKFRNTTKASDISLISDLKYIHVIHQ